MEMIKKSKWIVILIATVLVALSCKTKSGRMDLTETDSVSKPETTIEKIAYTNNAEIDFGQLASRNGDNEIVREYAEEMVDQHKKAQDELESIAQESNVTLDDELVLSNMHKPTRDSLSFLSGEAFDSVYIQSQIKMHSATIDMFEAISDTTQDQNLKNFVDEYLPKVRMHRMKADSIANLLFGDV